MTLAADLTLSISLSKFGIKHQSINQ